MKLPKVVLGTSSLGNLYQAIPQEKKTALVKEYLDHSAPPYFFDTAGKYGAGLALESLGRALKQLNIATDDVLISNKLGWLRTELKTPEPTFEPGVWKDLKFDAKQKMGYEGILQCYEQGNQLLNGYQAKFVSVHDPDEYMAAAVDQADADKRYKEILAAYNALFELKRQGKVQAVGVGAKDWRSIERLSCDIAFDWVMIANSMTIHDHPKELLAFMQRLDSNGVSIINSAVYNGGFITGGDYYNYKLVEAGTEWGNALLTWRKKFYALCKEFDVKPATAAIRFGVSIPGVDSIAVSSTSPQRLRETMESANARIPVAFWEKMRRHGLLHVPDFSL